MFTRMPPLKMISPNGLRFPSPECTTVADVRGRGVADRKRLTGHYLVSLPALQPGAPLAYLQWLYFYPQKGSVLNAFPEPSPQPLT